MQKRGLSAVVASLLIVLITIVAVILVWNVVKANIEKSSDDMDSGFGSFNEIIFGNNSPENHNIKKIPEEDCGDGICNNEETCSICEADCSCEEGYECDEGSCIKEENEENLYLLTPVCSEVINTYLGEGTLVNPYQITNIYQLQCIKDKSLSASYILINDINCSATSGWNAEAGFVPIGVSSTTFAGTFDGNGKTISDLYINRASTNYVGLFGYSTGNISNVGLVDVNIIGKSYIGGLVGVSLTGTIINCSSSGIVTGSSSVGGLAGYLNKGLITNSYSGGSISGINGAVGGLVGNNMGTIENSYATGSVNVHGNAGGLVGNNIGTIENSYATGSVTGVSNVGGLVGRFAGGAITNSYSTGKVTGSSPVGGLVGGFTGGTVTNSFWDTQTSGQGSSAQGTGKTTAQMKDIDTFSGATWDIVLIENYVDETWNINNTKDYPRLRWEN